MDGWKWNLDISIIFLSKTRVISRWNQNLPPLLPLWTHIPHTPLSLCSHTSACFSGRSFLQPEATYCVDQPSCPFNKARWPQMSGRHVPQSSVRSKWELKVHEGVRVPLAFLTSQAGEPGSAHPGGRWTGIYPVFYPPSVMLLYVLKRLHLKLAVDFVSCTASMQLILLLINFMKMFIISTECSILISLRNPNQKIPGAIVVLLSVWNHLYPLY